MDAGVLKLLPRESFVQRGKRRRSDGVSGRGQRLAVRGRERAWQARRSEAVLQADGRGFGRVAVRA